VAATRVRVHPVLAWIFLIFFCSWYIIGETPVCLMMAEWCSGDVGCGVRTIHG
jgi:hypothetical protein